jgi:hypothetical protein
VLIDPSEVFLGLDGDLVAIEIETLEKDVARAHDRPGEPWYRKTSLLVGPLTRRLGDAGIHHYRRAVSGVVHEHALLDTDLRRSKTYPRSGIHRLEHVVCKLLQRGVDIRHVVGPGTQNGVAEKSNGETGHGPNRTVTAPQVRQWKQPELLPHRVDLDTETAARSRHRRKKVAERLVVGCHDPPLVVVGTSHLDCRGGHGCKGRSV